MRQKKDILFFGAFILLCLVLIAGFAGARTESEVKESCLPNTPCSKKNSPPVQDYHWNPVSRGLLHI